MKPQPKERVFVVNDVALMFKVLKLLPMVTPDRLLVLVNETVVVLLLVPLLIMAELMVPFGAPEAAIFLAMLIGLRAAAVSGSGSRA